MKKINYLLVIALTFMLGLATVLAAGPKAESSELVVGGVILFQKGALSSETIPGATYDASTNTLTLTSELAITNGEGIKVMDMGDEFVIVLDGNIAYELQERNDGIFISNTKVTIKSDNKGSLKVTLAEGSGIIVDGESALHVQDVALDVSSVRFKDSTPVDVTSSTDTTGTTFYKEGQEIAVADITLADTDTTTTGGNDIQEPTKEAEPQYKRRDSLGDVAVYAIVAGLLIVGGIVVILMSVKNQKK